uniref:Retrotransposon gag domain-containing protein n=1 Tax=Asparagus officinalis TaxID=4686 RepID=Q2AA70_ASPOF|nr:hypothetical protein 18.t00017 [Asparagus officinalis]
MTLGGEPAETFMVDRDGQPSVLKFPRSTATVDPLKNDIVRCKRYSGERRKSGCDSGFLPGSGERRRRMEGSNTIVPPPVIPIILIAAESPVVTPGRTPLAVTSRAVEQEAWLSTGREIPEVEGTGVSGIIILTRGPQMEGGCAYLGGWYRLHFSLEHRMVLSWEDFVYFFDEQYISSVAQVEKKLELTKLEQGDMTVAEYESRFMSLLHFTSMWKSGEHQSQMFLKGLRPSLRRYLVSRRFCLVREVADAAISQGTETAMFQKARENSTKFGQQLDKGKDPNRRVKVFSTSSRVREDHVRTSGRSSSADLRGHVITVRGLETRHRNAIVYLEEHQRIEAPPAVPRIEGPEGQVHVVQSVPQGQMDPHVSSQAAYQTPATLSSYYVSIDYFAKTVSLRASDGSEVIVATSQGNRFVESFLAYVKEVLLWDRGTSLSETRVVFEYSDVFQDILGLPLVRDIEFCIEMQPDTAPISQALYRIASAKMRELQI